MTRSGLSSATRLTVGIALLMVMTSQSTNELTPTTDLTSVKVAVTGSPGRRDSPGTVSVSFIRYNPSSAKDLSVRSEKGRRDCLKAYD